MTTLVLEGVGKRHGRAEVLRGVTFSACAGDFLMVVGPNGAGKTTLVIVERVLREAG